MARKMRKFSAGGAQGKYDRRMADIKKDFEKDSAGKSGKALEVLAAKRAQRIADAEDDRAKRTGADRTATRAAEKAAEANLTKTRKFGADKPVAKTEPTKTEPAKAPEAAKDKPQSFAAAFKDARSRLGAGKTFTYNGKSFTTNIAGEGRKAATAPTATKNPPAAAAKNPPAAATPDVDKRAEFRRQTATKQAELRREANRAAMRRDAAGKTQLVGPAGGQEARIRTAQKTAAAAKPVDDKAAKLSRLKVAAEAPGATQFAKDRYKFAASSTMYAKGGKAKTMKYAKGGSTPPQPTAAERKAGAKFRESIKDIKPTPAQGKILDKTGKKFAAGGVTKEMPSSKAMGSMNMAKGGKAKAKAKGKPFAATKFGAALMKKSADTKGRAMPKFAKGGSIDGCAVKGKTKTSMVKMARGGAAQMRSRDSYGGANFKKGGSC